MTRNSTIEGLARRLAIMDGWVWKIAPNAMQARKQATYQINARSAIAYIETSMNDFSWTPERENVRSSD